MFGGLLNAFFANEGFILPRMDRLEGDLKVFRPGFLGNVLVGAAAAVILAALYSPLGGVDFAQVASRSSFRLTLASIAGAILSGVGGSRLLTQEAGRRYDELVTKNLKESFSDMPARENKKGG
jgi:hypothetical protein